MRKVIILFACSFCFITAAKGQAVVSDPAMLQATISNWAAQLEKAQQQYNQIKEQSGFLKESIDQFKKVNSAIKSSIKVKNLIDRQVSLVSLLSQEMKSVTTTKVNADVANSYKRRLEYVLEASKYNIQQLTEILTDSHLNLSDYERLKLIDDLNGESHQMIMYIEMEKAEFRQINNMLEELELLNE